jgi:hypothetical protein
MEHLVVLLNDIQQITLDDIADLPKYNQHHIVEHLEQLQDDLRHALENNIH